ncbi:MAG TPA: uroporphyrinogen decarboxylase, partial [Polyangiales bacterium]|nr:uroporphyrinogen decarboxylase [Polyangiales bacterium]
MSAFLKACRGEPTSYTPIWLMRQAGRYQPEYRAIRAKVSFVELCKNPDLSTEVTLLPVKQLGVDAAILFADILLILEPLGIGFEFTKNDGPHIAKPVRDAKAIDGVSAEIQAKDSLGYVMQTVKQVRAGLPREIPLIGFSGAPFTLASYAIEGGGSRDYKETKQLMYQDEGAWNVLLTKLTDAVIDYLNAQVDAGADALQVFDSWIGALGPADYARYVAPHMKRLFASLNKSVPHIHFGTGTATLLTHQLDAGGDVIGLDWRVELGPTWQTLGAKAVQGNLDPYSLLAPREELQRRAQAVLDSAGRRPGHIFNLGHGMFPEASGEQAKALVEYVHEA